MSNLSIELMEVVVSEDSLDRLKETNEQYIFVETIIGNNTNRYVIIVKSGRVPYINITITTREEIIKAYIAMKALQYGENSVLMVGVYTSVPKLTTAYMLEEAE